MVVKCLHSLCFGVYDALDLRSFVIYIYIIFPIFMTLSIFSLCRLMLLSSITAEYIKLGIVDTLLLSRFSIHFILLYSKYFADFFFVQVENIALKWLSIAQLAAVMSQNMGSFRQYKRQNQSEYKRIFGCKIGLSDSRRHRKISIANLINRLSQKGHSNGILQWAIVFVNCWIDNVTINNK